MTPGQSPWWQPSVHEDRRPFLLGRNRLLEALRAFFAAKDFTEVETAILQVSPGNETHLHAFATDLVDADLSVHRRYLHTSPEFACKKLLAAGEQRIFTFAKVFRNRERTGTHHPEFTMLEWYRAGEPYQALMADCTRLLALAAETGQRKRFSWRGIETDPFAEPERLSVAEAFERFAGIDLLATLDAGGASDRDALAAAARAIRLRVAEDDTWSDIYSGVLVQKIEPHLGQGRATILYEYPSVEAALARRTAHDPRVSERFELYACGVELANAFGELTDPAEQRRRFEAEMDEKQRIHGERYPIDEEFLAALAIMPEASGIALGLDRLAMLATGASRIEQVIWTPVS
ncbi:EF-P lysine aminoacylase EpmA [Labrys okinawensis]|uniref:EF-P lysine aminoacylase EpmA n=1 Tax=Labrys okinawensis TaxID=346911 RepID=UPI0039BD8435